jgi:hypothetical protein
VVLTDFESTLTGLRYIITGTVTGKRSSSHAPTEAINVETEVIIKEDQHGIAATSQQSSASNNSSRKRLNRITELDRLKPYCHH